ncbi:hypothetical protein [Rubellimicrobium arenae]|uniref:hypothetical protein n=1 Tax=Rubellimicrobium arenae TaxID=2817372 RepID=UPI001B30B87F|nr:hypothetical protein [Rubellimicrobium arenae]
MARLRTDRRAPAVAAWPLPPDLAAKRDLIASAGGRFCAVTFTKKDGSERLMQVQPAALRHRLKGEAASDAARRATFTRQERHPHLLPVWDVRARGPRSINLATVSRIAVNGGVHRFAS